MSRPLLQRHTRLLLIWLPIILVASSFLFYLMLQKHTRHAQEKFLLLKQQNIQNAFIKTSGKLEPNVFGEYNITKQNGFSVPNAAMLKDTVLYFIDTKKTLPFQTLTNGFKWNGHSYKLTVYVSSTEIKHLIIKVFTTEAVILLFLLVTIALLSRKSSRKLLQPFFFTISEASQFDVTRNQKLILPEKTGTTEFDQLNVMLNSLTSRVKTAYINQKQFVENASHEIQTPLAIIRAKLELLINLPNITDRAAMLLGDITDATNRLSEMNKTLLLLAKIENNQFPDTETINIERVIREALDDCRLYNDNYPQTEIYTENKITVVANSSLIKILISNLINNAIVHNNHDRQLKVTIKKKKLILENTGNPLQVPAEGLFDRFKKDSHQRKTTGLGLALVKQICQLYHYKVAYTYNDGWHKVEIIFT